MSSIHNRLKLGLKKKEMIKNSRCPKTGDQVEKIDLQNVENVLQETENTIGEIHESHCKQTPKSMTQLLETVSSPIISSNINAQNSAQTIAQSSALEEFKQKYDELRKNYEVKRSQNDQLMREKKILEIEVMNCNKDYYQREISRLKTSLQKCQEENQDFKHRVFICENQKKEFEASIKCKTQELKSYGTMVQKEKVSNTEMKYQIAEKEKMYTKVIEEMQKSNFALSNSLQQQSQKINRLQAAYKQKSLDADNNHTCLVTTHKRLQESEEKFNVMKKQYDRFMQEKEQKICELDNQLRTRNRQSNQAIERLSLDLQNVKNVRVSQNLLIERRADEIKSGNSVLSLELANVRLQEIQKQLIFESQEKSKMIEHLEQKLLSFYSPDQYKELESKLVQFEEKRMKSGKYYQQKLLSLQKQNQRLKLASVTSRPTNGIVQPSNLPYDFNQVLRKNIEENEKLKKEVASRIDQIQKLREEIVELKLQQKSFENEIEILNKKVKSAEKNSKIELEVEMQVLKNQIDSLKRKLSTSQTRLQNKIRQNKQKDNFIQNSIIGKGKSADASLLIAELERIFLTVEKNSMNQQIPQNVK